jgi:hypothetical protein
MGRVDDHEVHGLEREEGTHRVQVGKSLPEMDDSLTCSQGEHTP